MSKAVLISIRPEWCELIASGKKTLEVRKTRPKLKPPFWCYIYCTKTATKEPFPLCIQDSNVYTWGKAYRYSCGGEVIGEFVCDRIWPIAYTMDGFADFIDCKQSCLRPKDFIDYGKGKRLYGWHISDLVIYDKPKELSRFVAEGDCDGKNCEKCGWFSPATGYYDEDDCNLYYKYINGKVSIKPLFRPPQSWCYVEEFREGADNG